MTMHVKGIGLKFPDGTEQTTAAVGGPGDGTGGSGVYTKEETDAKLATKANVGVSYTKEEADIIVDEKADIGVSYTKAETEARLATKADITDLESAVASAVPTGMIMLWSGSTGSVPSGWRLCDGGGGTPNLRDKFIVGAGSTYSVNATGGSADAIAVSHTHTASSNTTGNHTHSLGGTTGGGGSHSHPVTTAGQSSGYPIQISEAEIYGTGQTNAGRKFSTDSVGNHTHSVAGTANAAGNHAHTITVNAGGVSGTGKNLPPYYALAYIMKIT